MKKMFLAPALALAMAGGTFALSSQAFASTDGSYPVLVQRLSERFNLNPDDVMTVVTEVRKERHQQLSSMMEDKLQQRLDQAVAEGKLTESQKQAILDKHDELEANRQSLFDSLKTMTEDQRRAALEQHHNELKEWAKAQGIDIQYLIGPFRIKMHKGMSGDGQGAGGDMFEMHDPASASL